MKKIGEFLRQTSEISNKDRGVIMVCSVGLWVIGTVTSFQLTKARHKAIDLELENLVLKSENLMYKSHFNANNGDNQDEIFE